MRAMKEWIVRDFLKVWAKLYESQFPMTYVKVAAVVAVLIVVRR